MHTANDQKLEVVTRLRKLSIIAHLSLRNDTALVTGDTALVTGDTALVTGDTALVYRLPGLWY